MPDSLHRLAEKVLHLNGHLRTFDVDPGDREAAQFLKEALEAYGCEVREHPFSSRLTVTCQPQLEGQEGSDTQSAGGI